MVIKRTFPFIVLLLLSACGGTPHENNAPTPWPITDAPVEVEGCEQLKKDHGDKADC